MSKLPVIWAYSCSVMTPSVARAANSRAVRPTMDRLAMAMAMANRVPRPDCTPPLACISTTTAQMSMKMAK